MNADIPAITSGGIDRQARAPARGQERHRIADTDWLRFLIHQPLLKPYRFSGSASTERFATNCG
jgi:hypothetical protein